VDAYEKALEEFLKVTESEPKNSIVWFYIGETYFALNKSFNALEAA
jgi:tetratricopeptide (TPR) repeat protein